MNFFNFGSFGPAVPLPEWFPAFLSVVVLWSLFWKGLALWHAARRKQPWWFVILLVVNTIGILEIIYLFVVAKRKPRDLFKA
jgi:hypothetical protein